MYAVVLVGGFGTRLRPLTNDTPKPMLPVVHRPIIDRLVERLAIAGVSDVVLALGFHPDPFLEAFPEGRYGSVRVHYAVEPEPRDTAGGIAFAARFAEIDDTFVVANGDVMTDLDIGQLIASHRAHGQLATLHLTSVIDPSAFGVAEVDASGLIERFVEKPEPGQTDSTLISAGTYVFEPSVLDGIEPGKRVSVERDTFPELVQRGHVKGFVTSDYWIDVGVPESYLDANLDIVRGVRGAPEQAIAPGASIDREAVIVESVVGGECSVSSGVRLAESLLLGEAFIGAEAVVSSSIIAGHVGAGAVLRSCVIGAGYEVPPGAILSNVRLPAPL
jgi:mannose-1-phosphate guanylyltransferase